MYRTTTKTVREWAVELGLGELPWCQDNSCIFGRVPNSVGTNGGCGCIENMPKRGPNSIRMALQKLMRITEHLSKIELAYEEMCARGS